VIYISTAGTSSGVWMENVFFYFFGLIIAALCLLPIDQLVFNSCDLHIHCQY
jgi:hypothetical protein